MPTTSQPASPAPAAEGASAASAALPLVRNYLAHHASVPLVHLAVEESSEQLVVPREAMELFATILAHMAAGEGVSVVPAGAELTTQQAADLLNVSRPYLIKLLESEQIAYRLVGKHRRIPAAALMDYQRRDDQRRRAAADELSALTQELGLA